MRVEAGHQSCIVFAITVKLHSVVACPAKYLCGSGADDRWTSWTLSKKYDGRKSPALSCSLR